MTQRILALRNTSMLRSFSGTQAKPFYSWPVNHPQLSLIRSLIVLMGSPPLQELIWTLVQPSPVYPNCLVFFILTAYLPVTHLNCPYFTCTLKIPQGCVLLLLLLCQRAFPKSADHKETLSKPLPPCTTTVRSVLGGAWLWKSQPYSGFKRCLLFRGGRAAVRQPSWDHPQPKLCLWWNSCVCGQ